MLQIKDLNKKFYKKDVLCDLSFTFEKGHIYSILGANGCGRTTLFECISGDICYDSGDIITEANQKVMLSAKRESLPMYLTGYQFIKFLRDEQVKKVHVYQGEEGEEQAEVISSEPAEYDVDSEPDSFPVSGDVDANDQNTDKDESFMNEEAGSVAEEMLDMETVLQDSDEDSESEDDNDNEDYHNEDGEVDENEKNSDYDEIDQILALVKFDSKKKHLLIKDYDSKTRKKLQLAANLVKRPDVMMFDEILDYTDAKFMQDYINVLESIRDEHIILVSTGVLEVAESVPGDIIVLNNGKLNLLERESLEDEGVVKSVIKMLEEDEDE